MSSHKKIAHQKKIDEFGYNISGVTKADLGKYFEAMEYFSKAIELEPNNFVSYFNRASIKMHIGDVEGARRDFRKSEQLVEGKSYENYSVV